MEMIRFEWDENKNEINKKKHKISFEEAKRYFMTKKRLSLTTLSIQKRRTGLLF